MIVLIVKCVCVQAIFRLPGFTTDLHVGYDLMHTVSGVIKDTYVRCLQGLRYSDAVHQFEVSENNRFRRHPRGQEPWRASSRDIVSFKKALGNIARTTSSRVTGSRFKNLLSPGQKNKSHAMFLLAGPYGESGGLVARVLTFGYMGCRVQWGTQWGGICVVVLTTHMHRQPTFDVFQDYTPWQP